MITLPALADSDTRDNRKYRCGWCGHPTDMDGSPIWAFDLLADWSEAQYVNGRCCRHDAAYRSLPICYMTVS